MGESSAVADRGRQLATTALDKVSVEGDLRAAEEFLWQAVRASPRPTLEGAIATSSVVLAADGDICAAQRLLTGPAVRQYDSLFKLVQQDAPTQHLVLTTTVTNIGVELLVGDRARLLIFADQRDVRLPSRQASYAGAMFAVNAVRAGSSWKIDSIVISCSMMSLSEFACCSEQAL